MRQYPWHTACKPAHRQLSTNNKEMDRRNFAFDRMNFILLAVGMAIVILGFILMSGEGTEDGSFNPEIFSPMRIKVAPAVCFIGFVSIVYAIIRKPKDTGEDAEKETKQQ